MRLYSGTINAVLPGKMTSYKLFACPAEDMEEAQARALEESYKAFPLIDGWISHEYRLMRIPSDIIVLVIQDVMKELQEVVAKAEASNGK